VDGLAARTLVHGATKRLLNSQYYLAISRTTFSIILQEGMDVRAAVDHLPAQTSALGQQARIWRMDLLE
jgi:hypothetical protein